LVRFVEKYLKIKTEQAKVIAKGYIALMKFVRQALDPDDIKGVIMSTKDIAP
jgi:hypothetical protein